MIGNRIGKVAEGVLKRKLAPSIGAAVLCLVFAACGGDAPGTVAPAPTSPPVPICEPGMVLQVGESCRYPGRPEFIMTALDDTRARFGTSQRWLTSFRIVIHGDDPTFNDDGFWDGVHFEAHRQSDGSWIVLSVTFSPFCEPGMILRPGKSCSYPGRPDFILTVLDDTRARLGTSQKSISSIRIVIHGDDPNFNDDGFWDGVHFEARRQRDGTWVVLYVSDPSGSVAGRTLTDSTDRTMLYRLEFDSS